MTSTTEKAPRYYFRTRDMLTMAVLAGLSGVSSTAINAFGHMVHSALGLSGLTQWAAGLHVTLLLVAVGLTQKGGAATVTALLKGGVELLSGNTHGILILLIDLAAGLLIDAAMLAFRKRDGRPAMMVAGGLAAASNVFIFQLFASAPEDVLAFIWGASGMAFFSGLVFGGLLAHALLALLRRAGLAPERPYRVMSGWRYALFLGLALLLLLGGGWGASRLLAGPPTVKVLGACINPYAYAYDPQQFALQSAQVSLHDMQRSVEGVRLIDVLTVAEPADEAASVLATASDGYAFFITLDEARENPNLLLSHRGEGDEVSYEIVGAENPKAWVRNVVELELVPLALLPLRGALEMPEPYNPSDWQDQMDNARLDFGLGEVKVQGTRLKAILERAHPSADATQLYAQPRDGQVLSMPLDEVMADDTLRVWSYAAEEGLRFGLAHENGAVLVSDLLSLTVE